MRGNIPQYDLKAPRSLSEALELLSVDGGKWRPFAGGTDLMVLLESGVLGHHQFVSLWSIDELRGISATDSEVSIGAMATYTDLIENAVIAREFPNLVAAARETGAVAIQNRGTIGGNIANGSPAADTPPSLLVYDAQIELMSKSGTRRVPYEQFHTGYKKSILQPGELIRRVILPRKPQLTLTHYYRKVGTRKAQAISKVCFSGVLKREGNGLGARIEDVRIGLGAVAATPIRATSIETLLRGRVLDAALLQQAREALRSSLQPIDDIRSTAEYRSIVAGNLLEEFLLS